MTVSVFELFTIGIGPSSSHTVGPMKAAHMFVDALEKAELLGRVSRVETSLYGSLAATGKGHGTDTAVLLGLSGQLPELVDPDHIPGILDKIRESKAIKLSGRHEISYNEKKDLLFRKKQPLPGHPNGMEFIALDDGGSELQLGRYYSVGGGFVVDASMTGTLRILPIETDVPFPFTSAKELLAHCREQHMSISQVMLANEGHWRTAEETIAGLNQIWEAMQDCVKRGCRTEGVMPGRLQVRRRAADLYQKLSSQTEAAFTDPLAVMDWINLYALAVNEENATGGRVVTAPTNGAAGIIPAVAL